ncbi:MAG: hypothetical protein LBL90_08105 [Prevotellaceae bacterium]|jgi:hypothetical protein|nr:hypothetical protein [Prevotellaceae bacterium]
MEGIIILGTIIALIVAIAQICLFFKLWGMCNNIIKIRDGSEPDRITASLICYMKGDMDGCKDKLDEALYADILKNFHTNGGEGYEFYYSTYSEYKIGLKVIVSSYKKKYEKIGLTMPDVEKYKDPHHFLSNEAGSIPKADTPKNEPAASKRLKELSPDLFNSLFQEACLYHNDAKVAMDEVNRHCEYLFKIPNAMNNEFIPLHTNANGSISFYNLYFTHYSRDCTFDEFIFMNKGRYSKANDNRIKVNNFLYKFDEHLKLTGVYKVK